MIVELEVEDLAVLRRARAAFGPGLNVISGESGAGKSLVLRAIDLAAGGRADVSLVREGCDRARVVCRFTHQGAAHEIVREVRRDGRVVATLDGAGARLPDLRAATAPWLGGGRQGDAYRLRQGGVMDWLDRLEPVVGPRAATIEAARAYESVRARLAAVAGSDEAARAARVRELAEAVEEIAAAEVRVGEREALRRERDRLRNVQRLTEAAALARDALVGDADGRGARDLVQVAEQALRQVAALDETLAAPARALAELAEAGRELARDLDRYLDGLTPDPAREEEIGARLHLLSELGRRYGDDEAAILAFAEDAAAQHARLEGAAEEIDALGRELAAAEGRWRACARTLGEARQTAARTLEATAAAELRRLALPDARLFLRVEAVIDRAVSEDGADRVEALFAADAGAPLLPLAEAASGGETSRVLLALEAALAQARPGATWLFDEVEAGVGGNAAWDVAATLATLARSGQVVLVSHLAPVAAVADWHLAVHKQPGGARQAESEVRSLDAAQRPAELARMLSGQGSAAHELALDMLRRAEALRRASTDPERAATG